ncbi:MAG: ANTAR domain-containing protein [Acidobacteriia bacterium]|nr:ANTAR domain-containing protein [Terriglobia bacterium]
MSATTAWEGTPRSLLVGPKSTNPFARQHAFLNRIATRTSSAVPFEQVLAQLVDFVISVVECDSCFVYVLEGDELVLRASKNPHPEAVDRLKLKVGQGITGWVAQHRQPVAVACNACNDVRFQFFNELPEDRFEAFLSVPLMSRGRVVGVLNLQNRAAHDYSERESTLISTVGFLVGAEIEMARLEKEKSQLADQLKIRKVVERAKGILQRQLKISEPEAYEMLQRQSQQRRKPMRDIAEAVVLSHAVTHNECD